MSDEKDVDQVTGGDDVATDEGYKPPAEKSLKEIIEADQEDESLRKYKEALLGSAIKNMVIVDDKDPRKVIVKKLALLVDGREEMSLDLSGDLSALKKEPFKIKEGISYKIRIDFHVQREIVTGLRYVQKIYRKGIQVEKMSEMMGSYPPQEALHSFTSPTEDMPHGLLTRGSYTVKSLFTDDDKNEHLKWEWGFDLKKEWDD